MPFRENEFIYLVDEKNKKHWIRVAYSMLKIPSLGTFDGSKFKYLDDGFEITIAGKRFSAFRPGTIELVTSLDRGTQIIAPKDIASILFYCNIKTGDTILEIGAGSGCLTTALTSVVAPNGKVHTVELIKDNVSKTEKNLRRTGLDKYWSYQIGDVKNTRINILADALIMDVPDPENMLDNILPCLRSGGRICSYVPNANQVESIVNALRDRNFSDVFSIEIIQRTMEVHCGGVRPSYEMLSHTGYLVYGRKKLNYLQKQNPLMPTIKTIETT